MGSANGKVRDNGSCMSMDRSDGDRSLDLMIMGSPDCSQSPLMSSPQDPMTPLRGDGNIPPVYDDLMHDTNRHLDLPIEKGIPTLITWSHGGNDVVVEGSWDNWTSRKALQRMGSEHFIMLVLPSGEYHYKFIVNGEWRYISDLPYVTDEMGQISNVLDVHVTDDYVPESVDHISEFNDPPSPNSSYSQDFPKENEFAKDPPALPLNLSHTVLDRKNYQGAFEKPEHVTLSHLFIDKGWASQSVVALGLTHRYQSKYVSVVLYKPKS